MKTAYELAMERLDRTSPSVKLSAEQKEEIAELESRYKARVAEREIALNTEIAKANGKGDAAEAAKLTQQLADERKALQAEWEAKKEKIRQARR